MSFASYLQAAQQGLPSKQEPRALKPLTKALETVKQEPRDLIPSKRKIKVPKPVPKALESVNEEPGTPLDPLEACQVLPGEICCMCGKALIGPCKDCMKRSRFCPLVRTRVCRHSYHRCCIYSWLMRESYCVGTYTKGFQTDCGIDIE